MEYIYSHVQYVINNTFHSSLKASPAKILFGIDQYNHSDVKLVKFLKEMTKSESDFQIERANCREIALEATEKIKEYNKTYYDERHKNRQNTKRTTTF